MTSYRVIYSLEDLFQLLNRERTQRCKGKEESRGEAIKEVQERDLVTWTPVVLLEVGRSVMFSRNVAHKTC